MSRTQAELVFGKGAHTDALACLDGFSWALAGQRPAGAPYSVYELVWHMTFWMENELERIDGRTPAYPEHASEGWPGDPSPDASAWGLAGERFKASLRRLEDFAKATPEVRQRAVTVTSQAGHANQGATVEDVVWQTIVHNSHHLGQVVMVRRLLGAWPPPGGGDTW
ncbi:MAG TPA: DinB family protein [Vicinamibacteria bacterium]